MLTVRVALESKKSLKQCKITVEYGALSAIY